MINNQLQTLKNTVGETVAEFLLSDESDFSGRSFTGVGKPYNFYLSENTKENREKLFNETKKHMNKILTEAIKKEA